MSTKQIDSHLFVILGATSDLMRRKLLPALYHLNATHQLQKKCHVLGISRSSELNDELFRDLAHQALLEGGLIKPGKSDSWCGGCFFFQSLREGKKEDYLNLAARMHSLEQELGLPGNRVFYLALPTAAIPDIVNGRARSVCTRARAGP